MENNNGIDEQLEKYINEIEENKNKLKKLVDRLELNIENIEQILPKKFDYKTRYLFAERIQILSNIYDTILRYRSEITKQIKEQATLSKNLKINSLDDEDVKDIVSKASLDVLEKMLKK